MSRFLWLAGLALIVSISAKSAERASSVSVKDLQAQLRRLTQTVLAQDQQLQRLNREVQRLNGKNDELSHTLEKVEKQLKASYDDLDERMTEQGKIPFSRNAEIASAPATQQPPVVAASPPAPKIKAQTPPPAKQADKDTIQAAYHKAFNTLQAGHYQQAGVAFIEFIGKHPDSEYAANAQYWLGESYYAQRDFQSALTTFNSLLENFPSSRKRSHALLKIGYAYYELKDKENARRMLEQVRSEYPDTAPARLAKKRLQRLRIEGY
ncbi:MAG: tol-pal system protein YbgF [Gammaproteobacteria bacterium]|nr:tol-pal system protein YbgF [Gammaproteobacteria bacterium]